MQSLNASLDRVLCADLRVDEWARVTRQLIEAVGVPGVSHMPSDSVGVDAFADVAASLARAVIDNCVAYFALSFLKGFKNENFSAVREEDAPIVSLRLVVVAYDCDLAVLLYQYESFFRRSEATASLLAHARDLLTEVRRRNSFKLELHAAIDLAFALSDSSGVDALLTKYMVDSRVYSPDKGIEFPSAFKRRLVRCMNPFDDNSKAILMFFAGFVKVSSLHAFEAEIHEDAMVKMLSYCLVRFDEIKSRQKGSLWGALNEEQRRRLDSFSVTKLGSDYQPFLRADVAKAVFLAPCQLVIMAIFSVMLGPFILLSATGFVVGHKSTFDNLANTWSEICFQVTGYQPHIIDRYHECDPKQRAGAR